jgi:SulP family sulfate permease
MQSLGPYAPGLKEDFFHRLTPYFQKLRIAKGESLWSIGDKADAMYVLETGILRESLSVSIVLQSPSEYDNAGAIYDFPDSAQTVYESMLPGTIAGEMTFLAGSKRNATVVAERDCELWRMNDVQLDEFEEKEGSKIARSFRQILLRVSTESADGRSHASVLRVASGSRY